MMDYINSYPYIFQLVEAIYKRIDGYVLVDAYSVGKEQSVFAFQDGDDTIHLLAYQSNKKVMYWLSTQNAKPRSKYQTIHRQLFGKKISKMFAFNGERSFGIEFEEGECLCFVRIGHQSGIVKADRLESNKYSIHLGERNFEFIPSIELEYFPELIRPFVPLQKGETKDMITPGVMEATFQAMQMGNWILETDNEQLPILNFRHSDNSIPEHFDILKLAKQYASNWFSKNSAIEKEKELSKTLQSQRKKLLSTIESASKQLESLKNDLNYREWADILMANLHVARENEKKIQLYDFFNDKEIEIKLKSNLSLPDNAHLYYKKAKNKGIEINLLSSRIEIARNQLTEIDSKLSQIEDNESLETVNTLHKELKNDIDKQQKLPPFYHFDYLGFAIYIGRNAANNDELTLHFAGKNDLWLHAKDMEGSHVIIRNKGSLTQYPKNVVEKAASLAAYYSKARNTKHCPVIYCFKKYIRKPKGLPAGAVKVERYEVIFVEPAPFGA